MGEAEREGDRALAVGVHVLTIVCRDPKDDKFLELAVSGYADVLVTGDSDLLALNPFRDIPIITPADFVRGDAR